MMLRSLLPTGRALVALDIALAGWVAIWIVIGVATAAEVRGLRQLSTTATKVGIALQETGRTLDSVAGLPLVGSRVATAADRIQDAGRSTAASGRTSRGSIRRLSRMLGLALAILPSVPVLTLYLPLRLVALRERRALRRLWAARAEDPVLRRVLAQRALLTLPYRQLVGEDAEADMSADRIDALAAAELARVGVAVRAP